MRIISGSLGGRKIHPPSRMPYTRPTTDIAKEGLFNILQARIDLEGAITLDLFSGTGCISYELASRGAATLTIVEKDAAMYAFIKKNIGQLKITNASVLKMDVFHFLSTCGEQYDFIFAGPPYALHAIDELPKLIVEKNLIARDGYFVLEHTPRNDYETYKGFSFKRNYGTTVFSFFTPVI
ncbi:RsmD family RNA methyltransferase [Parafilimonas sp.]|uniref:RsmD family RNA methyltransferase n=1 Tax=Parafilimonas sp. TaxID=1969739 RepID=UPI0039E3751A